MKKRFIQAFFWVWFKTRGYYLWSKFWRWLLERDFQKVTLTPYVNIGQLETALSKMTWVQDPLNGTFDVISSPQKVEAFLREKLLGETKEAKVGDCDEFAQYAADRIIDMIRRRKTTFRTAYFMTINWLGENGKFHGHNICVYDVANNGWYHIGNWFDGKSQGPFPSIHDIALWFSNTRGKGQLIAYATATHDLHLVDLKLG